MKTKTYRIVTKYGNKEVQGYKIKVFDDIETFCHKDNDTDYYYINELKTGIMIIMGDSLKEVKELCLAMKVQIDKNIEYAREKFPIIN